MISGNGRWWSTGIVLKWIPDALPGQPGWHGTVHFYDDGCVPGDDADNGAVSTKGELATARFVIDGRHVPALQVIVDALLADAARMGILFKDDVRDYRDLYYEGDGEDPDWPPPAGWRDVLLAEATRIGWRSPLSSV